MAPFAPHRGIIGESHDASAAAAALDQDRGPKHRAESKRKALPAVLLLLPLLVVLPTLDGDLIRDDVLYLAQHPDVRPPIGLLAAFQRPFQPDLDLGLWRPVTTLSFALDGLISRALALPFEEDGAPLPHLSNACFAALALALAARLGRSLGLSPELAWLAAAAFTLHPARSEALFWISGRAELLMTLFSLAALVAAGSHQRWRWLAALFAFLAASSKEQGFVLVALIPLLPGLNPRTRLTQTALVLSALGSAWVLRSAALGAIGPSGEQTVLVGRSLTERVGLGVEAFSDYLRLLIWPAVLRNEVDEPLGSLARAWPAAVFLALGVSLALRRAAAPCFALALLALPLVPVLNIFVLTGETFAERFLALPTAGAAIALALSLARFLPRHAPGVVLILLVALTARTVVRSFDWRSEEALVAALERDDANALAPLRLRAGLLLQSAGEAVDAPLAMPLRTRAAELLQAAARRSARDPVPAIEAASLALELAADQDRAGERRGWLDSARTDIDRALAIAPQHVYALRLAARHLELEGDVEGARIARERVLLRSPVDAESARALAREARTRGREDLARAALERTLSALEALAVTRRFDPALPRAAAELLRELGRTREAHARLQAALELARRPETIAQLTRLRMHGWREDGWPARADQAAEEGLARLRASALADPWARWLAIHDLELERGERAAAALALRQAIALDARPRQRERLIERLRLIESGR